MASSMIEIFGDSLFIPDEDNLDDPLPSPNEYVLIQVFVTPLFYACASKS